MKRETETKTEARTRVETMLFAEVRVFLDALEKANPMWEDGDSHTLEIEGGFDGYDDADSYRYSFRVKRTQEEAL